MAVDKYSISSPTELCTQLTKLTVFAGPRNFNNMGKVQAAEMRVLRLIKGVTRRDIKNSDSKVFWIT